MNAQTTAESGGTTGRYLVAFGDAGAQAGASALAAVAGIAAAHVAESEDRAVTADMRAAGALVFDELGVAVVEAAPDQLERLRESVAGESAIVALEPERVVHALDAGSSANVGDVHPAAFDEATATWGLQVTRADVSSWTGEGVKLAILDTGIDLSHPDVAGRPVTAESFVAGEPADDGHGHGTHCAGTACGPLAPADPPRYGVAPDAELHAAKVLNNRGSGTDGDILAGLEWALSRGCAVASLSLGAATEPGEPYSTAFENAARRAGERGTLVVAAAGNESDRQLGIVRPVGHPANCPSVVAVAAVDSELRIAPFSNRTAGFPGGEIDIAAPGVAVHSSWPLPGRYRLLSGTSMATPHVAGVTALLAQASPGAPASELAASLAAGARGLSLPPEDVGAGLLQAP